MGRHRKKKVIDPAAIARTIMETLQRLGKPFRINNTRVTATELFLTLQRDPDLAFGIEDVESLFSNHAACELLRSALAGPTNDLGEMERRVQWKTDRGQEEFLFRGGIIITANRPLSDMPEV